MTTQYFYFTGEAEWAMVHTMDEKYHNYKINLKMDEDSKKLYQDSGIRVQAKNRNEDGVYDADIKEDGAWITFRRPHEKPINGQNIVFGKPTVLDENGAPTNALIGNGSRVTVKVSAFDTKNGVGHRLEAVRIDDLVPYEGKDGGPDIHMPDSMADDIPF